ncbi:MAG: TolC family protein, partial [Planctomycetales bacterium]
MPIGFRGATTQMQNIEHRISKARALLAQQEQEISYELAASFQQLDQTYQTAKTNYNRRRAAQRRVEAFEAEYKVGRSTVDLVLRAQISLAQAEIAYYSSLIGYNQALNELRYRKGTLLMDNSVYLSESLWTEDAYDDALRRAWERSFAFESPNKVTEPSEFVDDCIDCLDTANGTFDYHNALPMEESLPPTVPSPMEPSEAAPPAPDNRSALMPAAPEAGGLGGGYDEFVPEVVNELSEPRIETLDLPPQSGPRSSIVPAPPIDDGPVPLLPASDPFGPEDFVPPMPLDGRSRSGAEFKSPLSGSASRSPLIGGAALKDSKNEFEEPIETVEFSAGAASSIINSSVSPIPTFDDDYVADEGIQQPSGFSDAGSLQTAPRRSEDPAEQATGRQSSSWGQFLRRK